MTENERMRRDKAEPAPSPGRPDGHTIYTVRDPAPVSPIPLDVIESILGPLEPPKVKKNVPEKDKKKEEKPKEKARDAKTKEKEKEKEKDKARDAKTKEKEKEKEKDKARDAKTKEKEKKKETSQAAKEKATKTKDAEKKRKADDTKDRAQAGPGVRTWIHGISQTIMWSMKNIWSEAREWCCFALQDAANKEKKQKKDESKWGLSYLAGWQFSATGRRLPFDRAKDPSTWKNENWNLVRSYQRVSMMFHSFCSNCLEASILRHFMVADGWHSAVKKRSSSEAQRSQPKTKVSKTHLVVIDTIIKFSFCVPPGAKEPVRFSMSTICPATSDAAIGKRVELSLQGFFTKRLFSAQQALVQRRLRLCSAYFGEPIVSPS